LAVFDSSDDKGTSSNSKGTMSIIEICICISVGVICSLFGVGFVYLVDAISQFHNKLLDPVVFSPTLIRRQSIDIRIRVLQWC